MSRPVAGLSVVAASLNNCLKGDPGGTGATGPQGPPGPGVRGWVDVTAAPYSAKADGTTDDGPAIQSALDAVAALRGGTVYLPAGRYRVATHLTVPANVTLKGASNGPPKINRLDETLPINGTVLLAEEGAGTSGLGDAGTAFISTTGINVTLDGFSVFYPNPALSAPPTPYPPTIRISYDPDPQKRE